MRTSKMKITTAVAAAVIGLMGTLSTVANAEIRQHRNGGNFQAGIASNQVNRQINRNFNRGGNWQNRGGNWQNRGGNWNNGYSQRYYGYYGYNDYGRRYSSNNGFGIYLNLGTPSSGCGYAYRKWQYSGSRYWRSRYYNCIG